MPRKGGKHYTLVEGASQAMQAFRLEIAEELGLSDKIDTDGGFKKMTTVEVGQIGGEMVRRMMAAGEYAIIQRFNNGEKKLMPENILPAKGLIRSVTNNGNPDVFIHHTTDRSNEGQEGVKLKH